MPDRLFTWRVFRNAKGCHADRGQRHRFRMP
jgi:hypothetical protein